MGLFSKLAIKIEQLVDWYVDILIHVFNKLVSMRTQVRIVPRLSLSSLGKMVSVLSLGRGLPPQFNTELEVPGLAPGTVRWFSKPEHRQRDDPVLVLLHGGGYAVGLLPTHAVALKDIWDLVGNPRLSIVWLDYTLSVEERFPKQLEEAMALYRELIKISSNIILLGDSAGGHLSLTMSRELHQLGLQKPSAVILISPWTNMLPEASGSYVKHNTRDRLKYAGALDFGELAVPLDADIAARYVDLSSDTNWHEYLPPLDHVLVLYGEKEILVDDIEKFIVTAKFDELGAIIKIEPNGKHDSPVVMGSGVLRVQQNYVTREVAEFLKKQG